MVSMFSLMGLYAGGKVLAPAVVPVIPVEQEEVNPWYIGIGLIPYAEYKSYCERGVSYDDVTYGAMVRGGYDINQYFGLEARIMGTFWGKGPNGGERFAHYGLYAKPMYPVSERINVYGLAGYGYTESINSGGNGNLPEIDDWGFSWGIGLEFDLSDRKDDFMEKVAYDREFDGYADQEKGWGLFIDYQRLWDDHSFVNQKLNKSGTVDLDVISVGITYDF